MSAHSPQYKRCRYALKK